MKPYLFIAILLLASCADDTTTNTTNTIGTITLPVGTIDLLPGNAGRVGFQQVVTDSRCPRQAMCVWAGEATGRFWMVLSRSTDTAFFSLSISGGSPLRMSTDPSAGSFIDTLGYRIRLVQLSPYPDGGDPPIENRASIASLAVSISKRNGR